MAAFAEKTAFFTLSIEEVALAAYIINKPDFGRSLLARTYPDQSEAEIAAAATAARNSLISKDLCTISDRSTLQIPEVLQQAVFLLDHFDRVLGFYRNLEGDEWYLDAFLNQDQDFTCHTDQYGIIQNLIYGPLDSLPDLLSGLIFPGEFDTKSGESIQLKMDFKLEKMMEVLNEPEQVGVDDLLKVGMEKEQADLLAADLQHQRVLSTISLTIANPNTYPDLKEEIPKKVLAVIGSQQRTWIFPFEEGVLPAGDQIHLTSRGNFQNLLSVLLFSSGKDGIQR